MRNTLKKEDRLNSKKNIAKLFKEGKSINLYPLRVVYLPHPDSQYSQVLFSIPKRNFKKAVDRNRIKRQLREAYRIHKALLTYTPPIEVPFLLGYIYIAKEKSTYQEIESVIKTSLERLKKVKP